MVVIIFMIVGKHIMSGLNTDDIIVSSISDKASHTSNVCILIDYDNLFHTMKRYAVDVTDESYDICKFFNDMYGMNKIRSFKAYADFDQVNVSLRKLQEQRVQIRNVYGNNRNDKYRKNASDIELSIDAIESTYKDPDIDTYTIVTSDSDMIPIMSRLKYKGKQVHLFYTSQNTSQTVHFDSFCDFSCDILKLFKVEIAKGSPEYWFDEVLKQISTWYLENPSKNYGFTWLRKDFAEKNNITEQYSSEIINSMIDKKLLNSQQTGAYTTIKLPAKTETLTANTISNKDVEKEISKKVLTDKE